MNVKMRVKAIYVLSTILCLCFIVLGIFSFKEQTNISVAAEATVQTTEIKDVYRLGEKDIFPSQVTVLYDGNSINGNNPFLVFPNGDREFVSEYVFREVGEYKVGYTFTYNQQSFCAYKQFEVIDTVWSVSSDLSKAEYGTMEMIGNQQAEGIIVTLAQGDTFHYNQPLQIQENTVNEIVNLVFEQDELSQKETKTLQAKQFVVRLTDCYDENNYVDIYYIVGNAGYYNIRAKSNTQMPTGFAPAKITTTYGKTSRMVNLPDRMHNLDDPYKTYYVVYYNAYGTNSNVQSSKQRGITVTFDSQTNRVCEYAYRGAERLDFIVSDLDMPDVYDDNLFQGFTTGEVYFSLRADDYMDSSATLCIQSLFGLQNEELGVSADGVSPKSYKDTIAPVLTIDYKPTDNGGVYIAKNHEMNIYDFEIKDVYYTGDARVQVYRNYGTDFAYTVSINNNAFKATETGKYTIEYMAKDIFNNTTIKTVDVWCIEEKAGQSIPKTLDLIPASKLGSLSMGETVDIPTYTVKGINGEIEVEIIVRHKESAEQTIVEPNVMQFTPLLSGVYSIEYHYKDNVVQDVYAYEVESLPSDIIRFFDKPFLERYYIKNAKYEIEELYAYDFSTSAPIQVKADLYVSYDGGAFEKQPGATVTIPDCSTMSVKFGVNDLIYSETATTSNIIDVNLQLENQSSLDLSRFFFGGVTAQAENTYIQFNTEQTGDAYLEFINPISTDKFAFEFSVPQTAKLEGVSLILTDYRDESCAIK